TKGTGAANVIKRFGDTLISGNTGGIGIALYNGALYVESKGRILRYPLKSGEIVPNTTPEVIVSELPTDGDHPQHAFRIDPKGNLFVNLGSASNSCQEKNRKRNSPGHNPCTELETRGGIWRYDANKTGQKFSPAERYATGIRNGEALALDTAGRLFAIQHGRDQIYENWPKLYSSPQGQNLPAEVAFQVEQGKDYGWPECYYDGAQKKLVLAPEYGGDGGKKVGICSNKQGPIAVFPAHWGPNDLLMYTGKAFPTPYREGMYIA
ncbi:MAG: PQQ-dependent sugar dehydrogenase, partial [Pseudomonadota bacterium]|nr:PQQ-dependent sugar dehydrogenase [Pseudomonadota bacterium]